MRHPIVWKIGQLSPGNNVNHMLDFNRHTHHPTGYMHHQANPTNAATTVDPIGDDVSISTVLRKGQCPTHWEHSQTMTRVICGFSNPIPTLLPILLTQTMNQRKSDTNLELNTHMQYTKSGFKCHSLRFLKLRMMSCSIRTVRVYINYKIPPH